MILTVIWDSIWCIYWCFIRRPELLTLDEHMGSPPAFVGSALLICLVFGIVNFDFFVFARCLVCSMLLVLLDCILSWPLWFALQFISIPIFTILLGGHLILSKLYQHTVISNSTMWTFGFLQGLLTYSYLQFYYVDLWFSLMFINIQLFTILLDWPLVFSKVY
jgi:hypothetical protein